MPSEKTAMTVAEAGRKGGRTTVARYGREHYEEIGKKGGSKVREAFKAMQAASKGGSGTVADQIVAKIRRWPQRNWTSADFGDIKCAPGTLHTMLRRMVRRGQLVNGPNGYRLP